MQGKTKILRSSNQILISSYFYLSYDGATEEQIKKFNDNIQNIAELIHKETNYTVRFKSFNYFIFY
jgi:predicted RNA-binding protein with EMAP domain